MIKTPDRESTNQRLQPIPTAQENKHFFDFDLTWHEDLPGIVNTIFSEWPGTSGYISRHAASSCLILAGNNGCGKSHLARLVDVITPIHSTLINEVDLFENLKEGYGKHIPTKQALKPYRAFSLLIYDDLGLGHGNPEWLESVYFQLFCTVISDGRSQYQKVKQLLFITTNLDFGQLPARVGPRIASRLLEYRGPEQYFVDAFSVPDYRARHKEVDHG